MEYFAKFLRPQAAATPKPARDHLGEFQMAWAEVKVRFQLMSDCFIL
jgi:hypothetical protein